MSSHNHFHSAGDDEPSLEVEGHPASLVRREPVLAAFFAAVGALAGGVSRGLARRDRESTIVFGAALALLTACGWLARRVVTPLAVPRRDAETPLFDAPPDLLA
ncbi:MAG TPA: hypothetical protein VH300_04990 [Thermoleophilaceae bacterium]|jgi:hypothetical protein|nr:hypothetical protein [Thermoleophilaceae bacterium]